MTDYLADEPPRDDRPSFQPIPGRNPPDLEKCRARRIPEQSGFVDCLVPDGAKCPYALSFGYGFLCHHPARDAILANSGDA